MADDFERTHRHGNPLEGESAAAEIARAAAPAMCERILRDIMEAGPYGVTPDEWAARNDGLINSVRRRFTDLWLDGKIRHHPEKLHRENSAGNKCVVWVEGADPAAVVRARRKRPTPMPLQRIRELEAQFVLPLMTLDFVRAVEREHGIGEGE